MARDHSIIDTKLPPYIERKRENGFMCLHVNMKRQNEKKRRKKFNLVVVSVKIVMLRMLPFFPNPSLIIGIKAKA